MEKDSWQHIISKKLASLYSSQPIKFQWQQIGGGSINETFKLYCGNLEFFCKRNNASKFPQLLEKEKSGLLLLKNQNVIRTPQILDYIETVDDQMLVMEWIDSHPATGRFWEIFGKQLAELHYTSEAYFGLEEDNYMGSVPQNNKKRKDWATFFMQNRLKPLLHLCSEKSLLSVKLLARFDKLMVHIPDLFNEEKPAMLHGDLWNGNFIIGENDKPVLIDPAVYFGHRSIDLAMTTLFGGFDPVFYQSYHYHFPLPKNYKDQWQLCNLYPLLIHLYLFGLSYLLPIENTLARFSC